MKLIDRDELINRLLVFENEDFELEDIFAEIEDMPILNCKKTRDGGLFGQWEN